jgi:hypothetical protein
MPWKATVRTRATIFAQPPNAARAQLYDQPASEIRPDNHRFVVWARTLQEQDEGIAGKDAASAR